MAVTISDTFNFSPSATASPPYTFSFEANSSIWLGECRWNLSGQRWYLHLYSDTQELLLVTPMVSSPTSAPRDLLQGLIPDTVLYFFGANAQIQIGVTP